METPLNGDAQLSDGWRAYHPMMGCELEATRSRRRVLHSRLATADPQENLDPPPMVKL